jgi:Na+-transporting methylmalonyl-CoA/oxaloacetate decarboxylase gamma subunit
MKTIIEVCVVLSFMFIPALVFYNISTMLKRHKKTAKRQELRKSLKIIKNEDKK